MPCLLLPRLAPAHQPVPVACSAAIDTPAVDSIATSIVSPVIAVVALMQRLLSMVHVVPNPP